MSKIIKLTTLADNKIWVVQSSILWFREVREYGKNTTAVWISGKGDIFVRESPQEIANFFDIVVGLSDGKT